MIDFCTDVYESTFSIIFLFEGLDTQSSVIDYKYASFLIAHVIPIHNHPQTASRCFHTLLKKSDRNSNNVIVVKFQVLMRVKDFVK